MTLRNFVSTAPDTTLNGGIDGVTTSVVVGSSSGYPTAPFTAAIQPDTGSEELVEVTNVSGPNWTVTRGIDGTSAVAHTNGAAVRHVASARDFNEANAHINASTNIHGLGGGNAVVGTGTVQTLTNKSLTNPTIAGAALSGTLSGSPTFSGAPIFPGAPVFSGAPSLTDFTSMAHDHGDADDGGLLVTAAPAASAVGDTVVTGTAASYSRTDHKHAREAFGNVTAEITYGLAAANGAATTVARSDHTHGTPPNEKRIGGTSDVNTGVITFGTSEVVICSKSITGDGSTKVKVIGSIPAVQTQANGNSNCAIRLYRDSTQIGRASMFAGSGTTDVAAVTAIAVDTPPSGAHTYELRVVRIGGDTGTQIPNTSSSPSYLIVEQLFN